MREVLAAEDMCGTPSSAIHLPEDEYYLFFRRDKVVVMSSDSVVVFDAGQS